VDSITVVFNSYFDLEYGYDFLIFYDGPSVASDELVWFTGYDLPSRVVKSSTGALTLLFYSDQLITGHGFKLSYYANICPNQCSNNGNCILGVCQCFGGWAGAACNVSVCNSTSCVEPYGLGCDVVNGDALCDCVDGKYGRDCHQSYCTGITHYHKEQGRVTDHQGGGDYLDNSDCTFLIQPTNFTLGDTILLKFLEFNMERDYDFVSIYDGLNGDAHQHFLGTFSGTNIPPQFISLSGSLTIRFTSDVGLTKSGFLAEYNLVKCDSGCNQNGICYSDGQCFCDHGWQGASCDTPYCGNNCWNHGVCHNGTTCQCDNGYSDVDCGRCNQTIIPSCALNHCNGVAQLTAQSGIFSDRTTTSSGDYIPNQVCAWLIKPSGPQYETIAISMTSLDLEDGEALIRIFDGANTRAPVIGVFTGSWFAAALPTILSTGPQVYVTFTTSNSNKVRTGFTATYSGLSCNHTCVNGRCSLGNQCECDYGFTGPRCNQTQCVGNCGDSNGVCDSTLNQCLCNVGFYGPDCTEDHCSDQAVLVAPSGVFSDHAQGSTYRPNSQCSWLIQPPVPSGQPDLILPITLVFTKFQLQDGFDYINVYDGDSSTAPMILSYTGSFLPNPVISTGNSLYIEFVSDNFVEFSGFRGSYSVSSLCPSGCSGNGYCIDGTCSCFNGGGPDCSAEAHEYSISLPLNQVVSGIASEWQWVYYFTDITEDYDSLIMTFAKTSTAGDPEFYIDYKKVPTLTSYMGKSVYYVPSKSLTIKTPRQGRYFIGVYGREGAAFNIGLTSNCGVAFCNDHGTCSSQVCSCDPDWYGERCELQRFCDPPCVSGVCGVGNECICNKGVSGDRCEKTHSASNSRGRAAAAALIVILIVGVILGASFLIYRHYKNKGKAFTQHELGAMPGVPTNTAKNYKQFEDEN